MSLHGTPSTWSESDRFVPRAVVRPVQRVLAQASSGAVLMGAAVAVALLVANSGLADGYERFWSAAVQVQVAGWDRLDHLTVRDVVNDGLMTLFFLLVALELKRERTSGHLRDTRAALQPIVAAVGGMVVPASVYVLLNHGGPGAHGWGVPMATDIVFAVAVVAALGERVPMAARVFLLTLAVVDDLGGILVIAAFYADGVSLAWLTAAVGTVAGAAALRQVHVRSVGVFIVLGAACWLFLFLSGVHPTVAGVAFGLLAPARAFYDPAHFPQNVRPLVARFEDGDADTREQALRDVRRLAHESESPLGRTEARLAPWVTFGVVPVFAFANAGIALDTQSLLKAVTEPVALGVALGLVLGKPAGILLAVLLLRQLGVPLPANTSWRHMVGIAVLAGIGFTVALFLSDIAFAEGALGREAATGVLAGSLVSATLGWTWLRFAARAPGAPAPAGRLAALGMSTNPRPALIDTSAGAEQSRG